jgi:integrase
MASLVKRQFRSGPVWYIQYYAGDKQRRVRASDSYQIGKEKLRQFESARARGDDLPLPTRTVIADVLEDYVRHIRTYKTPKSAQTNVYYLSAAFGPICDGLKLTYRKPPARSATKKATKATHKRDGRFKERPIEADCFERITTADISAFIDRRVQLRELSPRTANHFRAILMRLFNWAMTQRDVKMPGDKNPASAVRRQREPAPEIRFLTLEQIDEQLKGLSKKPRFEAMVATLIYSGLRREELLWLTPDDVDWETKPFGVIRVRAKTVDGESWQPKTKVNRAVPISSRLRPYLDRQRLKALRSEWLFPTAGGKRYDPDNFSRDLRRINNKAGLPWSALDFRHTFGSQLAMKGESLYKIATLMGNSPEICQRHYAALMPESLIDSVEFGNERALEPAAASNAG